MEKVSILVITIGLFVAAAVVAQDYPTGLVSYWKLDDGSGIIASDSVGSNDGTLINGPIWTSGIVSGALSFDRTDDYVRLPDVFPSGNSPRTIEAWFKLDGLGGAYTMQTIAGWGTLSTGRMSYLDVYENINGVGSHGIFFFGARSDYDLRGTSELSADTWYHAVVTYDGSSLKLYLNGNLENSKNVNLKTGNDFSSIGKTQQTSVLDGFNGTIDEVAIYNRALTTEEIQQHYQNGLNGIGYGGVIEDTNKGHGNNPDGLDNDNPGQGCENKNSNGNKKRCA